MVLAGKTVIVTGAGPGIGLAVAEAALGAGAEVLVTGRDEERLAAATVALSAISPAVSSFVGDATVPEDVNRLVDAALGRWPRIDVLVNNAGSYESAPFLEIGLDQWERLLTANLTGPFLVAQRVGRTMVERGGGSIVNLCTIITRAVERDSAAYSAAKAGLAMLTKSVAVELGPHGVRCNSISPGYVGTRGVERDFGPALFERLTTHFERAPLRRIVTPKEVAAACVFLASDAASGITGLDVPVDGGLLADIHIGVTFPQA